MRILTLVIASTVVTLSGCGASVSSKPPPEFAPVVAPEEVTGLWLYGSGVGATLLNIGTTIAFPPYGLYLLADGALQVTTGRSISPVQALPEEDSKQVRAAMEGVTGAPGRLFAAMAGREYVSDARRDARMAELKQTLLAQGGM